MLLTSPMAHACVMHLIKSVKSSSTLEECALLYLEAKNQITNLSDLELIDVSEESSALKELKKAYQQHATTLPAGNAEPIGEPWASRIRNFTQDPKAIPLMCKHPHQQTNTGTFYRSIGVIQCAACKNWQDIRQPF